MLKKRILSAGLSAISSIAMLAGCENDKKGAVLGTGKPVTVSGVVVNIDNFTPATGVKVYLLDNDGGKYATTAPTGADGAFSLQIPSGSKFWLATDDFDGSKDDWFPLVNVDPIVVSIDSQITETQIHACPQPTGAPNLGGANSGFGSVAVWNNYLTNGDPSGRYEPTKASESGGILSIAMYDTTVGFPAAPPFASKVSVSLSDAETSAFGPIGYVDGTKYFNFSGPGPFPDPAAAAPTNEIMAPATTTETNVFGFVQSYGKATYAEKSINLTFKDNNASRVLGFSATPYEVPVRKGMISLMLLGNVDGKLSTGQQAFCKLGFTTIGCE